MEANLEFTKNRQFARHLGAKGFTIDYSAAPEQFLPPAVSGCTPVIKSVLVTTGFEGGRPVFGYEVKWILKEEEKKEKGEEPVPLSKKVSESRNGKLRCEGPCGELVEPTSTVQFGCDHVICEKCRQTAQSITLFDGSPGCCNEKCVKSARLSGEKICVGPADSTQSVLEQHDVIIESIQCHVATLKLSGNNIIRIQNDLEFPSSARVSRLLKSLSHFKDITPNARFYYSDKKPSSRDEMHQISLLDTHLRFGDLIDVEKTHNVYFLIVNENVKLI